ncbi:hypothetical protein BLNAU_5367 [Blattamonas nauphoetae]|uniref:Uncharacterized protein n=1 Tax=Blattamonas nauphoetae TaxID=2049346 RepID=A0ABQ9Y7E0_9EUKA|nr:hypothetical protein BLNAU_5367 [Blattamonas nauphoetae]
MNTIIKTVNTSSSTTHSDLASAPLPFSVDSSPFLNWSEDELESEDEKAILFWSLVATVKSQPALDASLEAKAVEFLDSVCPWSTGSADALFNSIASLSDHNFTDIIQSFVVLISYPKQYIVSMSITLLDCLVSSCSAIHVLDLVEADLIPQLINTLNPLSLSLTEADNIHTGLHSILSFCMVLATKEGLFHLEIEDRDEQEAVSETVFKQVLAPSEHYIRHLCVNRISITSYVQWTEFMILLAQLLQISSHYQPTMDCLMNMPVFLTIPSCLTFFESDPSIWHFFTILARSHEEWNEQGGDVRRSGAQIIKSLRAEGMDDVVEQKLRNEKTVDDHDRIADFSTWFGITLGTNLQKRH